MPNTPTPESVASNTLPILEPGTAVDDFVILKTLGVGGFSRVYLALQHSLERIVALKTTPFHDFSELREAKALAELDHPGIVRVFDARRSTAAPIDLLFMQFVPGGSLLDVICSMQEVPEGELSASLLRRSITDSLKRQGESPRTPILGGLTDSASWSTVVCFIGSQVAYALSYAHSKNRLHADIKPANILLTAEGSPMIADFNVSTRLQPDRGSSAHPPQSTPEYSSPEILETLHIHGNMYASQISDDLYSLGVVLWELLTGTRPFAVTRIDGTFEAMVQERRQSPKISQLPAGCPLGLQEILLKCLSPDANERFTRADEVARALQLCIVDSTHDVIWKWRAHRVAKRPAISLFLCGLVPNLVIAGINNGYNSLFGSLNRDILFSNSHWLPVNLLVFSSASVILLAYAWPLAFAVWSRKRGKSISDKERILAIKRSIRLGHLAALVVFLEWLLSGIIFSLMNDYALRHLPVPEKLAAADYFEFIATQALHGLFAAPITFIAINLVVIHAYLPHLIRGECDIKTSRELREQIRQMEIQRAIIAIAPCIALLCLALFRSHDSHAGYLLTFYGSFGLVAFWFGLAFFNGMRSKLGVLSVTCLPTSELLALPLGNDQEQNHTTRL